MISRYLNLKCVSNGYRVLQQHPQLQVEKGLKLIEDYEVYKQPGSWMLIHGDLLSFKLGPVWITKARL